MAASTPTSPRAALLATLLLGATHAQAAAVVREVRFWSSGEIARVAIETDSEVRFDYDRLQAPDRIYFDLYDAVPSKGRKAYSLPVADGLIKQVRVALKEPTVTRVVLDLENDVDYSVSQLANPERIVVELRLKTAPKQPRLETPRTEEPTVVTQQGAPDPPPAPKPEPRPFRPPPSRAPRVVSRDLFDSRDVPSIRAKPGDRTAAAPAVMASIQGRRPLPPPKPEPKREPPPEPVRQARATPPKPVAVPEPAVPDPGEPRPAEDNSGALKSLTRVLGLKLNRVVLDAGHGGQDHGTTSPNGVVEKELVLDITLRLGKLIEDRLGAEVLYTRRDDRFVALDARAPFANGKQADLFLSIHANSSPYRAALGTETYFLNLTSVKADLDVAARENASSEKSVHDLQDLVQKIARNDKLIESRDFAGRVQRSAHDLVAQSHGRVYNRGVKSAPFVVLIGAKMPAVLVEIGFLTNPAEEALMKKGDYRQRLAEALFRGVSQYAESLSGFRVARRDDE